MNTQKRRPPNILIIQADQLSAPHLSIYGGHVCQTPHLTDLATRSTVFTNAYCNSPLCGPSRASMLTGKMPSQLGTYDNACDFSSSIPTIGHVLQSQGYRTIVSGKMHFIGSDQNHGFEERLTTDIYPTDYSWTPSWGDEQLLADYFLSSATELRDAGIAEHSAQLDFDKEVADRAIERLTQIGNTRDTDPYCLIASFTHPHDPFVIPKTYWDRYSETEIGLPAQRTFPPEMRDAHSARLFELYGFDSLSLSDEAIKRIRRAYFGAISFIDDQVGRLLNVLAVTDSLDDTVVIFLSDHGEMLGERGMWFKSHFFEPAVRVPFIIYDPRHPTPRRVREPVSLLDLFPTIADLSGVESVPGHNSQFASQSQLPGMVDEESGGGSQRPVFAEYLGEGALEPVVMVRLGGYKLIASARSPQQLFHTAIDADETTNLIGRGLAVEDQLRLLLESSWDLNALEADVLHSQQNRNFTRTALAHRIR